MFFLYQPICFFRIAKLQQNTEKKSPDQRFYIVHITAQKSALGGGKASGRRTISL